MRRRVVDTAMVARAGLRCSWERGTGCPWACGIYVGEQLVGMGLGDTRRNALGDAMADARRGIGLLLTALRAVAVAGLPPDDPPPGAPL